MGHSVLRPEVYHSTANLESSSLSSKSKPQIPKIQIQRVNLDSGLSLKKRHNEINGLSLYRLQVWADFELVLKYRNIVDRIL